MLSTGCALEQGILRRHDGCHWKVQFSRALASPTQIEDMRENEIEGKRRGRTGLGRGNISAESRSQPAGTATYETEVSRPSSNCSAAHWGIHLLPQL